MRRLILLTTLAITFSCTDREQECEFTIKDEILRAYNDVLNELVVKHFYGIYLGDDVEKLYEKYFYANDKPDTINYKRDLEKLRAKIENDTVLQYNICLRNQLMSGPWTYRVDEDSDLLNFEKKFIDKMKSFSLNSHRLTDSLQTVQSNYCEQDFHSCKFKITAFKTFNKCYIGTIGFSKIAFNTSRDKAILYYEFVCGGKCGMGEIILIEKRDDRWSIIEKSNVWIS